MIIKNAAKCLKCGDVIESKSRHDFRSCTCGAIFVDGGHEYLRRGADSWNSFLDLSESEDMMNKRQRRAKKVPIRHDVYLSGPMTSCGDFDTNVAAFGTGAAKLRERGFTVFSPPEFEVRGWTWQEYLRSDVVELVSCRMLVLLPGWECSKGAILEKSVAEQLGMPVHMLADAVRMRPR
ncbi:MAG: DUF7695 domain-containing protein [Bacteroidota bacterium]